MVRKTILEKEKIIQKVLSQLIPCNNGKCHITRQGKYHHFHYELNNFSMWFPVLFLLLSEICLTIVAFFVEHKSNLNDLTIFAATIPFAIFTIWYAKHLHREQKKYSEFLQFKETMNYNRENNNWDKSIEYGKLALEYEPTDVSILNTIGGSYMNLEEYDKAIIYFERMGEWDD